ncbi:PilC/PilY family type IV pilus protein [Acidovorax sp. D2M1]|uniref:PilC/PilY family type IV pilus protein n=1 Tax=Acidovorax benzenivorans TaxID=2987520 RepID=A0ABT5S483_9BURK|nr:PilC/PilY family type IV pilus protein [Acidovorax benzenivorans]MDD2180201.1 PilC/PilY family type IV pilus protein [Acidovorax benzenivorans]
MKFEKFFRIALLGIGLSSAPAVFASPQEVSTPQPAIPPNIVTTANKPMIMLTASKDHLIFGPVYTDFEDLDGDGIIDTTFKPTFKYYGYFDATKCYSYSTSTGQYEPSALAIQTSVTVGTVTSIKYSCSSAQSHWSGNFLNWATMTRLDTVRRMLYGGFRSTDTNGSTVLMGSRLVWDAHSFVKYYKEADIRDYTPFTQADLTKTTGANANVYAGLSICVTGSSEDPKASVPIMRLVKGNVRFWSTVEIQLCRWRDSPDNYNKGTFGPKLARFYSDADKGNGVVKHEITIPSRTADGATYSGIGPDLNVRTKVCDPAFLGEEHCQAFPPTSTTNFKPYGLLQEFGYPKNLGDAARVEFGLITGSYDRKNTAGALRKNVRDLEDEINRNTGVFCHSPSSGCSATLPAPDGRATGAGAIKAFDSIVLYGRTSGNSYGGGSTPSASNETNLPAWGNPIGEMVVQALQYYAYNGSTPTPNNPSTTTADTSVGMPIATWSDPLASATARAKYGNGVCRPLNVLAFSSSGLSFDGQAGSLFGTLPNSSAGLDSFVNKIGDAEGITGTLRSVGSTSGKGLTTADDKNSCAAKTVGQLSDVNGICPEAPAMGGTYQIAGAALYGNTTKIRTLATPPADLNKIENALKVKTMAASLSGGAPRIDVPVPGTNPKKYVYITPESVQGGGNVSAPLTFASISSGPTYGAFIVTWNDILMGGDYDMDITGFLRYDLIANAASPSGWDIKITTDIPGVCGGAAGTHGFSVIGVQKSGVNANGRYLTHQHGGGSSTFNLLSGMPATSEYLCGDAAYQNTILTGTTKYKDTVCSVTGTGATGDPTIPTLANYCSVKNADYLVGMTFNMVGEVDALIKDPLWYAGKYGSFKSSAKNADGTFSNVVMPSTQESWDSVRADGSIGSDGVPDGYFLARRPELLEAQLRQALDNAAKNSNAAPAVSSAQLVANGYKYVVKFDSTTVTGALEAYKVDSEGEFAELPTWEAGALLEAAAGANAGANRKIITNSDNGASAGVPFRWASLPAAYKTQMTTASINVLSTSNAQLALNYIRGDKSLEGLNGLRQRSGGLLGPVVNGTPWIQSAPSATMPGMTADGYAAFLSAHKSRGKLLWVAANDGMLHAFNPESGAEVFAYVPGALANRLAEIPLQRATTASTKLNGANFVTGTEDRPTGTVWPYVDGNPFTADVKVGSDWKTYAFGTLGRGGRGVFALDATQLDDLVESNAASVFRWQFTSDDDNDLGYITGDVSVHSASNQALPVVKLNNGKYALLLGNGNKSITGKAVLFVLFMEGPNGNSWSGRYVKIVADAGAGNGLSAPRWEDVDGNGTADVVYAGDLKGNLWKFNIGSSNPVTWDVAFKNSGVNTPLYKATYTNISNQVIPLPITTAPQVLYMGKGGLMVTFATGNAFETGDFPSAGVIQRAYGIWDRPGMGASGGRALPTGLTTLIARSYTRAADGVLTLNTGATLDWEVHDGWYFNLPATSEAVLSDPSLDAGVMSFVTVRPKSDVNECTATPNASLYTVDPISGRPERNTQGTITVSSQKVIIAGKEIGDQKVKVVNDRTKKPFTKSCKAGESGCTCVGATCTKDTPICSPGQRAKRVTGRSADAVLCTSSSPRLQWREIPGLRTNQ